MAKGDRKCFFGSHYESELVSFLGISSSHQAKGNLCYSFQQSIL